MVEYENKVINDEILAAIAAAIAAMETRPGYRLVVRSMRQIPVSSPAWNTTGRIERLSHDLNS